MNNTTIYEPFFGWFTGKMSVYIMKNGFKVTFQKPHQPIEKDKGYVLKVNVATGDVRFLVVTEPEWL
jgi:hypothetical protein